jgi:HAD superfamily hydrolase (TIGR01549 family)
MAGAVFFDLWNTLIYCPTRVKVDGMLRRLGLEGRLDYYSIIDRMEDTVFLDSSYTTERFLRELAAENNGVTTADALKDAANIWDSRLEDASFFPDAQAALIDLKRRCKVGLISNTDAGGSKYAREKYLEDIFDAVVMSCDIGYVKPDPAIFETAVEELDAKAADCWMVGDSVESDVEGALNAGLKPVLIDRSGKKSSSEYPVVRSLKELLGVIQ